MEKELLGKIALITGGREGMGRATAEFLAEKSASVVIVSRNEEELKKSAEEISSYTKNPDVLPIAGDVGNNSDVEKIVQTILKKFGRIDYLLNFAGYNSNYGSISVMRPSSEAAKLFEKIVNVDLVGTFRMVNYVEPIMRKQNYGVIITVASTPVLDVWENDLLFQTAKVGNKQMTEVIANQHKIDGVTGVKIYCIAPGNIFNRSTYESMSEQQRKEADKEQWLHPKTHIAFLIYNLLTGKLQRESGSIIRMDVSTMPQLFSEVEEKYIPFTPK